MNPIKLPTKLRWGGKEIQIDGAMERVLKGGVTAPEPEQEQQDTADVQNLDGFIYVPSIKLYVAKSRDLNRLSWNQAIDKIYTDGINVAGQRAEMPTPFEFMSYVKYLLSGNIKGLPESERHSILNDILKIGNYRGNWLNSRFVKQEKGFNKLGMETFELDSSGKAVKKIAHLEQCLWADGWADIDSGNAQGLLTKTKGSSYEQGRNVYFWYPRENFVARFIAYSAWAYLGCDRHPDYSSPSLGVRLVVRPKGAIAQK